MSNLLLEIIVNLFAAVPERLACQRPGTTRRVAAWASFALVATLVLPAPIRGQEIPPDLLEDEHVREEFGVNTFTTPSIKKIFEDLDKLGDVPYERLKREIPEETPKERTKLALGLGGLIADGFLVVQAEKLLDLEEVGRALLKHAKMLGAGTRLSSHTKSLLEHSTLGEWNALKDELAKTQKDVETEMVLLRDVDAAHLISLGGWLRAFEIGCVASLEPYNPDKAAILARADIAEYFLLSLSTLEPRIQEQEHIQNLSADLEQLLAMLDVPEGKKFTESELKAMHGKIVEMIAAASQPPSGIVRQDSSGKGSSVPSKTERELDKEIEKAKQKIKDALEGSGLDESLKKEISGAASDVSPSR